MAMSCPLGHPVHISAISWAIAFSAARAPGLEAGLSPTLDPLECVDDSGSL